MNLYKKRLQKRLHVNGLATPTIAATRSATEFETMQQEHIEQLKTELAGKDRQLAEARADADHWKSECNALQRMVHEARAEIENLRFMVHNQRCCRNCGNHASWQFDVCGFGENPQDENEGPHCRRNDLKRWRPMEYRHAKETAERGE